MDKTCSTAVASNKVALSTSLSSKLLIKACNASYILKEVSKEVSSTNLDKAYSIAAANNKAAL